jgi:histidine triad (HIT) family protein
MDNCIFCKIISGQIPAYKVYEDETCLAFLDIQPVSMGHTLLIPKSHYEWIQDTPDDILTHVMLKAKKLINNIKESLPCDYVQVSVVGKDVPHFHVHLIPRTLDDQLKGWDTLNPEKEEFEQVLEKIKI